MDKFDKEYIVHMILEILCELGEARQDWVDTVVILTEYKRHLSWIDAVTRARATAAAGGAKALGSNEKLREQALTIILGDAVEYNEALSTYDVAFEKEACAKQRVLNLVDTLKTLRDVLGTLGNENEAIYHDCECELQDLLEPIRNHDINLLRKCVMQLKQLGAEDYWAVGEMLERAIYLVK